MENKDKQAELVIVVADDWEGLFVDGKLIDEGHKLGRDGSKHAIEYAAKILKKYNPSIIKIRYVTPEYYDNYLSKYGNFPQNLEEVDLVID
jgi:hypothetical protein